MKKTLLILSFLACLGLSKNSYGQVTHVVISQVYGAGGNTGASYKNDFVELFNPTSSPVTLTGWSVQYMAAAGTSSQSTALTGTIQPGAYYLVQESGGANGAAMPSPDASGGISMATAAGKVFLCSSSTSLSGSACPTSTAIVDYVGFGTTANCFEGTGPTPAPSATTSATRASGGCVDTDQNASDFTAIAVNPRNSSYGVSITAAANNLTLGNPFSYTVTASTNPLPTSFSVTAGSLPAGLSLDGVTGIISGTATVAGSYTVQITANNNCAKVAAGTFSFTANTSVNNVVSFVGPQTFTVCQDVAATSINSLLQINDADFGQTETYTITAQPTNGVVVMGSTALSNGGTVTPTGFTYKPNAAFNGTDMFTVQVDDGSGTPAVTTVTVTVNAAPTVTATTTNSVICAGDLITLTAGGTANTYTWTNSVTDGTPFAPTGTTTYSVTGTDVNNCTNMASVAITVNNLPLVQANTTATVVCAGDMITLTGANALTYTWSSSVADGVAFAPSGTNTYTVTGTDVHTCTNTASVMVTVNNLPIVQANATATVVCASDMITLTGGGALTYTWTNGAFDNAPFSPSTNTYSVTGTDANGCNGTASVAITVNPLPTVTATATATVICAGDVTTLTGTGSATTYTWTGSVTDGVAFAPTGNDTYTVTGIDANNCVNTDMITVTVNTLPTVNATATATVICAGDMTTLTGTGSATTYIWTGSVTDGVAFAPTGNDTYTVTGTDANNCSSMASIMITVNTLPTVNATATATVICAGDMTTLTGTGTATTYTWTGSVTDGTAFAPTGNDTYTVTGTDANNCSSMASIMITVNTLPTVNATATATVICAGDMTTLTGTGTATTYTWTGSVTDGTAFAPTGNDTYTVTGTDANNCSSMASIMVTVNMLPSVQANATATVVCAGGMTTLTATGTATTYTWSGTVVDGTAFAPATGTDTYTVTGTDANNCMNSDMITVTVNALPSVQANTTATVVCEGGMITLTGGGATTYTWSGSVVDGTAFAPATGTDTYTVTGTDANNCMNTDVITVTVSAIPATPSVTQNGNVLSSSVTAASYQWSFNGVAITTNGTSATYTATANGVYQVEVFNAQNCSSISTDFSVTTVGIASVKAPNAHIYPNPASSFITVEADAKISLIEMYDISGKVIISETPATYSHTISLNGVQPGVYFLKTEKNNQTSVQKIIVQ